MDKAKTEKYLMENLNWIRCCTRSYVIKMERSNRIWDMDDMYQEAYIAFLSACNSYDESKNVSIQTYAYKFIFRRLACVLRKKNLKNIYGELSIFDEFDMDKDNSEYLLQDDMTIENVEFRVLIQQIEKTIWNIYNTSQSTIVRYGIKAIWEEINGKDSIDIAKELGVTPNYLSLCKIRAREKLMRTKVMHLLDDLKK